MPYSSCVIPKSPNKKFRVSIIHFNILLLYNDETITCVGAKDAIDYLQVFEIMDANQVTKEVLEGEL